MSTPNDAFAVDAHRRHVTERVPHIDIESRNGAASWHQ
jgi:hypothetical protein